MQLEESGRPWACLNVSRSFGLRQVLACHPCRCRVGVAHGGSRIDVEVVREQLGDQGILCVEVYGVYGVYVIWDRWYCPITQWWVVQPVLPWEE